MPDESLVAILEGFGSLLEPLAAALESPAEFNALMGELGWTSTSAAALSAALAELQAIGNAVSTVDQTVQAVTTANSGGGLPGSQLVSAAIAAVQQAVQAVHALTQVTPGSFTNLAPFDDPDFWAPASGRGFPELLLDYLFSCYVEQHFPVLYGFLTFTGILAVDPQQPPGPNRVPYSERVIYWDRLPDLIDPAKLFSVVYGWGANFDDGLLMCNLAALFGAFGVSAAIVPASSYADPYYPPGTTGRASLGELSATVFRTVLDDGTDIAAPMLSIHAIPIPATGGSGDSFPAGIVLFPVAEAKLSAVLPFIGGVLTGKLTGDFTAKLISVEVRPDGTAVKVDGASGAALAGEARIEIDAVPAAPWTVLGTAGQTHLEVSSAHAALAARGNPGALEFLIELGADKLALVINLGQGDGFIQTLLGSQPQRVDFSLDVTWSSRYGLQFSGQAKPQVTLPLHLSLASVLSVESVQVALAQGATGAPPTLVLEMSVTGGLMLGPLAISVDRIGAELQVARRADGQGVLGDLDLSFGFKPPTGAGLAIDSAVVTGGGYLFADPAAGQYAGAIELQFETIGLSAVGLLTTKLPGGQAGYSLVVLISVTFPPIELGFGFALSGVGGLVGVNRTVNVTALQSGLAAGSLDAVLFPADLASNAQRVVTALERYFPAAPGQFVIGPAVQIIWGEDGIFTASIGVLVEFPNPLRVVLLGRLDVALPTAAEAITEIELDVLGVVDFTAKTLGLDAVLRNSHVADFPLSGAAALRASWGAQPGFLFAAGGFNPRFTPPASFPRLDPLALSLSTSDNPRLRVSAYLAVSSNTVQVGGLLDFSAQVDLVLGKLGVTAALGVDTLFQLHPFAFFIDLHAMVAVTWNGSPVLSAQLDGTFTGPKPLYLAASATVQFLGTHHVHVELTIPGGDTQPPPPPPPVDAAAELRDALGQPSAWHSDPPPGGQHLVRLAGLPSPGGNVRLHPLGVLTVRQRRLPLGQTIQQLGSAPLPSPTAFTITAATFGQDTISGPPTVQDYFARGQFFTLPDADKLAAPSFELMDAGVSLSSAETQVAGGQVSVSAGFSSISLSPAGGQATTQAGKTLPDSLLAAGARSAPGRRPGALADGYLGNLPQVTLSRPGYVLATGALTAPDPEQYPTYSQAASQRSGGDPAGTQVVFADEVVTRPATPAGPPLVPAAPVTGIVSPVIPPGRGQPFPPPPPPMPPVPVP